MEQYCLVAYFNEEIDDKFKTLWTELSERNITQYGVENSVRRPHITIADYMNLDVTKFIPLLDQYTKHQVKLKLQLNVFGTFIKSGVLFLAPTITTELANFHQEYHKTFEAFNSDSDSLYVPNRWVPHCTIASRLSDEKMLEAIQYCQKSVSKMTGELCELALLELKVSEQGVVIEDRVVFSKKLSK